MDCMPSLGMLTINALAAADSVVIPTQPHYLSAKGLELLLRSVSKVKRQINPHLRIDGILIVMVESNLQRTTILPSEKAFAYKMRLEAKEYGERIIGYGNDAKIASQHMPQGEDKFCPMTLNGVTYKEKADAGGMLLAICKENPLSQPIQIGSYRGFQMEVFYDTVNAHYCLNLCGMRKYKVDLGTDALGNLTRI